MSLLAISYPKIDKKNFKWIQDHRKKHDGLYYEVMDPHIVLVFPVFDLTTDEFVGHISEKAAGIPVINFELRCATVNKDSVLDYYHEFLVPDLGNSDIIKLHDRLYSERMLEYLRLDIDYIPHLGIGNSKDPMICKENVDKINETPVRIPGTLEKIDIISFQNSVADPVETIRLG